MCLKKGKKSIIPNIKELTNGYRFHRFKTENKLEDSGEMIWK